MNKNVSGGAGYRSRYLSHAKRALYHLSYAPEMKTAYRVTQYKLCSAQCVKRILRKTNPMSNENGGLSSTNQGLRFDNEICLLFVFKFAYCSVLKYFFIKQF